MPFIKGQSGYPAGRAKGSLNKDTKAIRAAYQALIENNLPLIQGWINEVAKQDKNKAFEMLMKLSPFVVPKLTEELGQPESTIFVLPKGVDVVQFNKEQNELDSDENEQENEQIEQNDNK